MDVWMRWMKVALKGETGVSRCAKSDRDGRLLLSEWMKLPVCRQTARTSSTFRMGVLGLFAPDNCPAGVQVASGIPTLLLLCWNEKHKARKHFTWRKRKSIVFPFFVEVCYLLHTEAARNCDNSLPYYITVILKEVNREVIQFAYNTSVGEKC